MSVLAVQVTPGMDFTGLSALVTAVGGVLLTLGTLFTNRQRRVSLNAKQAVADLERRDEQYRVAIRHIRHLEDLVIHSGGVPPDRPMELTAAWWDKRRRAAQEATDSAQ